MKGARFRLVDDVTKLNTDLTGRLLIHPKIDSAWYLMKQYMVRHQKGEDMNWTLIAI